MAKPKLVRIHPSPDGVFLDGIPAVSQDVPEEDAAWMVASGAFTFDAPPPAVDIQQPEGATPSDTTEV